MRKIGVIFKKNTLLALTVLDRLYQHLYLKDIEIYLDEKSTISLKLDKVRYIDEKLIPSNVEIIIVLGGDGTFLHAASLINNEATPILGVNLGSLGFLTETLISELCEVVDSFLSKGYEIEKRCRLRVKVVKTDSNDNFIERDVLNDISINNGKVARIIDLDLFADGEKVTSYRSDGLVISTPTGSTAYSLSAGGPIIYPTLGVVVVSPICPHTLTMRPLVIPSNITLTVKNRSEGEDVYLTFDGQLSIPINGDISHIEISQSPNPILLIKSGKRGYFKILETKLKWSGTPLVQ